MDWLFDDRTDSWSVITTMPVKDYLALIEGAHSARGGISGQRDVLTTTTAKRIRSRMVGDIRQGAVLPAVVIGAVVPEKSFKSYPLNSKAGIDEVLPKQVRTSLAIIDGMQRTAAFMEAVQIDSTVYDRSVRVEFWLAKAVSSLVYRMLVLNTGQVPWTLNRQLSVVYTPLLNEIRDHVTGIDRIFFPDRPGRRVAAAQYASDSLVELYLAFSLRKTNVDSREELSNEFSRLDIVENLSDKEFQGQFYVAMSILTNFDRVFAKYDSGQTGRFVKGRNVFDGQPARIGLVVAVAQEVLGRPGLDRSAKERRARMSAVRKAANGLESKLDKMSSEGVGEFLKLDVLSEILDRRVGQVGRYERSVFLEAFKVLIEEKFDVPNLEPCWRAN
jgi:hypothetical protein